MTAVCIDTEMEADVLTRPEPDPQHTSVQNLQLIWQILLKAMRMIHSFGPEGFRDFEEETNV